ncbi:MAG: YeeE/YedE family protein [Nitratireductor sp.]|nr:YeeE/YedE family protein [Nitratireductor sp.]
MDFVPLIDSIGEPATLALAGFVLAFVFGFAAERSGFCTRSAILEIMDRKVATALPVWLLALGVAILSTQLAIFNGWIDVGESRFFRTPQSLSGALIGGALFGIGMALARGCTSRLMVLGAGGNLRALAAVAAIALAALATYQGFLVPFRDAAGGIVNTSALGGNEIGQLLSNSYAGLFIGGVVLFAAAFTALRSRLSAWKSVGGVLIGTLITAAWYVTHQLSEQVFDPIEIESLSFSRPSANAINYVASGGAEEYLSLDTGMIAGLFLGAFAAALLFRSFAVRGFGEAGAPHFSRYIAGGALMGFGGILAVGCTVGAGFTGGSVLAVSSVLGLASMMTFCAATDLVLRRLADRTSAKPSPVPAE